MKAQVEIRLTSPIRSATIEVISGLDELFDGTSYKKEKSYRLVICSPWLESAPLDKIVPLLDLEKEHQLYILTCRAHTPDHLAGLLKRLAKLHRKPFHQIVVGYLPASRNPKRFSNDILHAKMYFLIEAPTNTIEDENSGIIKEAYFGSANFTMNGTGQGGKPRGSNRKFEIVARLDSEDTTAKTSLYGEFLRIWWNCDEDRYDGAKWVRTVRYR